MAADNQNRLNVLVSGATGFLGSALVASLSSKEAILVRAAVRRQPASSPTNIKIVQVGDLGANTDWEAALKDIQVVVHTAARVHIMNDSVNDPLTEYRRVNVEGTLSLARQAAAASVKRFIFISSIKVNGESTEPGKPFTVNDQPAPIDPYGISKWESEIGLLQVAKETGMEVVIIRPPLVYGPGVRGNFLTMMRWISRGVPLPLGAIHNKRSLVALDNLVDLIITCIDHPAAANQTFLVADGEDLSTSELLRRLGKAMAKPARLIPLPAGLLTLVASLLGKKAVAHRLCGSLQVDISEAQLLLGWKPPVSVDDGLRKVVEDFKRYS